MNTRNRFFFKGKIDLGPKIKITDDISKKKIRYVYIVNDQKRKRIISVSKNTGIFLIAREMNLSPTDSRVLDIWKKIDTSIKFLNQDHVMILLKYIEKTKVLNKFSKSLLGGLSKGKRLTEKQLNYIDFQMYT